MTANPIAYPLHMLDCCMLSYARGGEIVTSAEPYRDLKQKPSILPASAGSTMRACDLRAQPSSIVPIIGTRA